MQHHVIISKVQHIIFLSYQIAIGNSKLGIESSFLLGNRHLRKGRVYGPDLRDVCSSRSPCQAQSKQVHFVMLLFHDSLTANSCQIIE